MLALTPLLPPIAALLLTVHLGYAFSTVLLPDELRPYRALLMAPAGLVLLILFTAALTTITALTPPQIALGLMLAAVPINGWVWWREREQRTKNKEQRTENREQGTENGERRTENKEQRTKNRGQRTENGEQRVDNTKREARNAKLRTPNSLFSVLCSLFSIIVFLLALAPLLAWGFSAPIGSNWDAAEFYVPLGRALQLRSQRDLATLARNPLVQIMSTPPVSGRIHAFSYLHATLSSATGVDPLRSYAPVMAFVAALQPLGVYVLARVLGLGRAAALLGTAMLSLGWLSLWVTYNSFSNHLLALPLLPAALATSLVALAFGGRRAIVSGALFTAGLATAYFPAMSAYIVFMVPAALWLLVLLKTPLAVAGRGLALGVIAFGFSVPAQHAFWLKEGFLDEIQRRNTGFQIVEWIGLSDALGIVATFNRESIAHDPRLATAGLVCAAVLALAVLVSRRYPLLCAMLLGAAGYAVYTALDGYQYGFYKGVTFALPLLVLLPAAGIETLWYSGGTQLNLVARAAAVAAGMLLVGLQAATITQLQRSYTAAGPQLWSAADLEAVELDAELPPDASVLLVAPPDKPPSFTSLLAYTLLGHELHGRIGTGYTTLGDMPSTTLADAAVLPRDEAPTIHGYDARQFGWSGAGMRLYRRDPSVRAHRAFSGSREILPGDTLRMYAGADSIALDEEQTPTDGPAARLALAIASFGPTSVELRGTTAEAFQLPGGLAEVTSAPLQGAVELRNTGAAPVYLHWAELRDPAAAGGVVGRDDVFVRVEPLDDPAKAASILTVHTAALPEGAQKLTGLLVVSYTAAEGRPAQQVGQWVFFPPADRQLRVELELATLRAALAADNAPLDLPGSGAPAGDGSYELALLLANNARVVYATRLWSWRIEGGSVLDAAGDVVVSDLVSLPRAAVELTRDTQDGSLRLRGYTLARDTLRPGSTLDLDLVWQSLRKLGADMQARAILVDGSGQRMAEQVLPLGAPEHGTSTWQEGELAEQSFRLAVPADAAAGPATLRVELLGPDGAVVAIGDEPVVIDGIEIVR